MKLTFFLLLASFMSVSAGTLAQNITLNTTDAQLKTVLKEFKKQSGYSFVIDQQLLDNAKPVTLHLENAGIDEALAQLFRAEGLTYTIEAKVITIKEKRTAPPEKATAPLPPTDIIGRVTNEHGQPLNGASVVIKRTQRGTLTDANGNFVLPDVSPADTLIIGYVGYGRTYIPVGGQKVLKIVLKESTNQLDQVVIQAYGETSQRLATGDIGTIRAADIAKQPVMNVLDAVQGQIPGVIVTNYSGYASAGKAVEIRGRSTLNPNYPTDPLYIIDGVPLTVNDISNTSGYGSGAPGFTQSGLLSPSGMQDPLFSINPADIESIQVLKDADATAIYGSRGANGVILITTKSGKAGKTHFDLSVSQGSTFIARTYPLLNTTQYNAMRREALANDGLPVNVINAPDLVLGDSTRNTNWQRFLWGRTGDKSDIQASLSGGNVNTSFRISAGYDYQRDLTAASGGNSRGSVSLNLKQSSTDQRLVITLAAQYTYAVTNQIGIPGAPNTAPDAPSVYDKNGNLNFGAWDTFYGGVNENPYGSLLQPYSAGTNFLTSSFLVTYNVAKGLVFRTSLGYNNAVSNQLQTTPIASQDPIFNPTASVQIGTSFNNNIILEPQVEYSNFIGKGKVNFLAGATDQDNITTGLSISASGIENDALIQDINSAPPASIRENYNKAEYKYAGIFGRVNYNFEDKYIINLTARRDGSSRFGPGRQYGNFGSAGVAWIFTKEDWVKRNFSGLSFGKLRSSYGTTGGDQIGNYQYMTQWSFGNYTYNGSVPLRPLKHTDSTFHWNLQKKFEVALELGFFKDRVTTSGSFYLNRSTEQLVLYPTPQFTGFPFVVTNSPADVQNSGWEYELNAKIIDHKDLLFSVRFNIGRNYNKLVAFPNLAQSPYASQFVIGQPLNIRWLLHATGVDPQTGLYTFQDKNHDGRIIYDPGRADDDSYIHDFSPKYDGGLSLDLKYKNAELSAFFYFRRQMGVNATASLDVPGDMTNQPLEVFQNHWQKPGDVAQYAKFTTNPTDVSYYYYLDESDGVYTDIFYARLQNLFFSYVLPTSKWFKGIKEAKFTIQARNLFVLTNYKGTDPEIQSFNTMPLPRILTFGISANF